MTRALIWRVQVVDIPDGCLNSYFHEQSGGDPPTGKLIDIVDSYVLDRYVDYFSDENSVMVGGQYESGEVLDEAVFVEPYVDDRVPGASLERRQQTKADAMKEA